MTHYIGLLRGVNVGGKNKVPMSDLREGLRSLGYANVSTYIASGNVLFESADNAEHIRTRIEAALSQTFKVEDMIKVLVMTREQLHDVIANKPSHFGDRPDTYHSDAIFLLGIDTTEAMTAFSPREGVDTIWPGDGVIYSQRVSAQRTKSRLNRITASPLYKSMTIRSWNTTVKLWELSRAR